MVTLTLKELQTKVNQICDTIGKIDTPQKLVQAQDLAKSDPEIKTLMELIVIDALAIRWRNDMALSVNEFMAQVTK